MHYNGDKTFEKIWIHSVEKRQLSFNYRCKGKNMRRKPTIRGKSVPRTISIEASKLQTKIINIAAVKKLCSVYLKTQIRPATQIAQI